MVTLLAICGLLIALYFAVAAQKNRNFARYLKAGDPVRFYIGEEKHYGKVVLIGRKYIHIQTDRLNGKEIIRKILPENVYPVWMFRYKKSFD